APGGRGAGDEGSHQGPVPRSLLYLPSLVRRDPGTRHHAHRRRLHHQVGTRPMSRHVVLLRRDPSPGLALRALLHGSGRVTELLAIQAWSALAAETVDAVVIDLPNPRRGQAVELVRSRFDGRLVLVLDPGDDPAAIPSHHACSIVQRPFEIVELWHLVTTDPASNGERAQAGRRSAAEPEAAGSGSGSGSGAAAEPAGARPGLH